MILCTEKNKHCFTLIEYILEQQMQPFEPVELQGFLPDTLKNTVGQSFLHDVLELCKKRSIPFDIKHTLAKSTLNCKEQVKIKCCAQYALLSLIILVEDVIKEKI